MTEQLSESRWSDEQATTVLTVLEAISRFRDREDLFTAIADAVRPVFDYDMLCVILDGPLRDQMTPYFIQPRRAIPAMNRSRSALDVVFTSGKPLYVRSREQLADRPGSIEMMKRFGAHSYIALPLRGAGTTMIGILLLQANRPNAYDGVDLEFATEVASAIGLALDNCLTYERIEGSRARLDEENQLLRAELSETHVPGALVAESAMMREVVRLVELVAPTDATVLISGQTGAGKERLARLIHERSGRADKPMLAINCAAIPTSLIESELFGHEAGAFTGATRRRRGRFELADGGTLMLDEVGELALDAQAKLLRVLQSQELDRVGGTQPVRVDVRVIAATNRPLTEMVQNKQFRADLYYRLAVFPIELPPLHARAEDIPILARDFVAEAARRFGFVPPYLDDKTIEDLQGYSWPGNVRELENVIERAVILSRGGLLDVRALLDVEPDEPLEHEPSSTEVNDLVVALEACRWVIEGEAGAAARLGLRPSTLRSRMRKLGIERKR